MDGNRAEVGVLRVQCHRTVYKKKRFVAHMRVGFRKAHTTCEAACPVLCVPQPSIGSMSDSVQNIKGNTKDMYSRDILGLFGLKLGAKRCNSRAISSSVRVRELKQTLDTYV